jgi:uncharacterized membrane protein SpoIIM required for sporulation
MTPLQFENAYRPVWDELDQALEHVEGAPRTKKDEQGKRRVDKGSKRPATRVAALYRATCEHLALARSRDYPTHITARLEALTERAHQAVYRTGDNSFARLGRLVLVDMPQAVRSHRLYMWTALAVFGLPLVIIGLLCYFDPGFILSVQDINTVREFDAMYGPSSNPVGRTRSAGGDWSAFGFYIMNNIGIAFKCFAGGVFFGLGSLFFMAFNGAVIGAVAGYLTYKGYTQTFYSFVVTHGAFELTAIVISGAAGLAIGHALVAPRRLTRAQALKKASADAVPLMYLATAMLFIAAAIEAFWSSSRWIAPEVKYGVGGLCWVMVLAYLGWQGRPHTVEAGHAG